MEAEAVCSGEWRLEKIKISGMVSERFGKRGWLRRVEQDLAPLA